MSSSDFKGVADVCYIKAGDALYEVNLGEKSLKGRSHNGLLNQFMESERRKAKKDFEQKVKPLIESSPDFFIYFDENGGYKTLDINNKAYE